MSVSVIRVLRWTVGAVFVWAGIAKWGDPAALAGAVQAFVPVPLPAAQAVALVLPPLECLTGLMLLTGIQGRVGSFSALILSTFFLIIVAQGVARGIEISCACFGGNSNAPLWQALVRNSFLLAVCVVVHRVSSRKIHQPPQCKPSHTATKQPYPIDPLSQAAPSYDPSFLPAMQPTKMKNNQDS